MLSLSMTVSPLKGHVSGEDIAELLGNLLATIHGPFAITREFSLPGGLVRLLVSSRTLAFTAERFMRKGKKQKELYKK